MQINVGLYYISESFPSHAWEIWQPSQHLTKAMNFRDSFGYRRL